VAEEVGVTERAAHRILSQLADEGYIHVSKEGRRNHYRVNNGTTLRHRANQSVPLQALLNVINPLAEDLHPNE